MKSLKILEDLHRNVEISTQMQLKVQVLAKLKSRQVVGSKSEQENREFSGMARHPL